MTLFTDVNVTDSVNVDIKLLNIKIKETNNGRIG